MPITIVRPSIIESALAEPRPGWIRGFRMAEPIIISYARGLLREFPGVPEGIIDVIPVDLVVAAILAVAARGPEPGRPKVYHVASGVRNPLRYGHLVELSEDFFSRNPLYDDRGQPINVPEWSFPGRGTGAAPAQARRRGHDLRGEAAHCLADPGQAGAAGRPDGGPARAGQARPRLRRALRRLHRDRRPLPGRQPARAVGRRRRRRPRAVRVRPGRHRLGPLRARDPPALGARAHPGAHQARASRWWTSGRTGSGAPSCRRTGISPCSTSSTR